MCSPLMLPLYMLAKSLFGIIFTCIYIYTAEQYPTSIRSTAYGFLSFTARIAGIIMPFFFFYIIDKGVRPTLISILIFTIVFGLLSTKLPESNKNKILDFDD